MTRDRSDLASMLRKQAAILAENDKANARLLAKQERNRLRDENRRRQDREHDKRFGRLRAVQGGAPGLGKRG